MEVGIMSNKYFVAVGTSCVDEYYEADSVPKMGEKAMCRALHNIVGGMIGNAAAVYASYSQPAYMMDFMNGGEKARWICDDMEKHNVNTDYTGLLPSLPDPKCIIMLHKGERIIYVVANHKRDLVLSAEQRKLLAGAEYVYSTASEMRALRGCRDIIHTFRTAGAKLVLDVEDNTITGDALDKEILQDSDILFFNEAGAGHIREIYGNRFLDEIINNGCLVVITLAANGCEVYANGGHFHSPGFDVPVVDTTGAGDTFNASFLYGLSKGWSSENTAVFANAAASRAIGIMGPRSGAAGEQTVLKFMGDKLCLSTAQYIK